MNLIRSTLTGEYASVGNVHEADAIIGASFGAGEHTPGEVNERLAGFVLDRFDATLPLILQQEIASAVEDLGGSVDKTIEGDPSSLMGGQLGAWEVLTEAQQYMVEHGLRRPILVTQAFLMGRLTVQAVKLGMDPIIPQGLPTEFDPESIQAWTRNRLLWATREIPGLAYLKLHGKL